MDSPEYKTLTQCYPVLISHIGQAPYDIAAYLIPSGILAPPDLHYISNPSIPHIEKASRLLDIVLNQVQIDPQVYHSFITALKSAGSWTKALVSELESTYARWMQSHYVPSTEEPGESLVVVF